MQIKTFVGGTHVPDSKERTCSLAIKHPAIPQTLIFPMSQHIGAPATPLVKKGDKVKKYQKIGEASGFVSAHVHSSVSGEVLAVEERLTANGSMAMSVVIENDFLETECTLPDVSKMSLAECVREAGVTGMGGAGFPTHVKLSVPEGKTIDTILVNGAECEPYLTSDHRVMLDYPKEVIGGLLEVMKALKVERGIIAIEENKMDAIEVIRREAEKNQGIEVCVLKTKYPQGSEKQLIDAALKRKVPRGGLPADAGVVVINIDTATAIFNAVKGIPLVERVVTVSGTIVSEPSNFFVKMGTPVNHLLEQAGGTTEEIAKLISGGPMMGMAMQSPDAPITKGMGAILAFGEMDAKVPEETACINCARCADACPIGLLPMKLNAYAKKGMYENCKSYNVFDCIECGSCTFVCPAKRHIVQTIRLAKQKIKQGGAVK